jgi:hypothetical protein
MSSMISFKDLLVQERELRDSVKRQAEQIDTSYMTEEEYHLFAKEMERSYEKLQELNSLMPDTRGGDSEWPLITGPALE